MSAIRMIKDSHMLWNDDIVLNHFEVLEDKISLDASIFSKSKVADIDSSSCIETETPLKEITVYPTNNRISNKQLNGEATYISNSSSEWMSLPLAPPPKQSKKAKKTDDLRMHMLSKAVEPDMLECEDLDDSYEESEYPIVLIEDYMMYNGDENCIPDAEDSGEADHHSLIRKRSIADFKKKSMIRNSTKSLHNEMGLPANFDAIAPVRGSVLGNNANKLESLMIYAEPETLSIPIPGSEKLKYCDICNKPLYEVSSMLIRDNSNLSEDDKNNENKYKEFVCWDCTEAYDEIFSEIYKQEIELQALNQVQQHIEKPEVNGSQEITGKLLNIFANVSHKYGLLNIDEDVSHDEYMRQISRKLEHHFLYSSSNQTNFKTKLISLCSILKYKLRWRWRLKGLIPNLNELRNSNTHSD